MKKRGFTLIELLAVIVILAIIALIATPIVMNVIENSRKGSAEIAAENIEKAAELYYYENRLDGLFPGITFTCNNENCSSNDKVLQINGKVPEVGTIEITKDGVIKLNSIVISGYNCYKENESYKCSKTKKEITSSTNGVLTIDSSTTSLSNFRIYGRSVMDETIIVRNLPSNYKQVEYIESTGTQYIDTEVIPNQNTGFDIEFLTKNSINANPVGGASGFGSILGARQKSKNNELQLTTYGSSPYVGTLRHGTDTYSAGLISNVRMKVVLKKGLYTNNNGVEHTMSQTFQSPVSLTVFALNQNNDIIQFGLVQLYSLKLYDGDVLIRDYVPCYRIEDNTVGLYDLVEGKFYENKGSEKFINGPEVEGEIIGYKSLGNYNWNTRKYEIPIKVTGKNLFDKDSLTTGLVYPGGKYSTSGGYHVTDYIEIKPSTYYYLTNIGGVMFYRALYDKNKNGIPLESPKDNPLYTPENAAYIRITITTSDLDKNIMFEEGKKQTDFESYVGKNYTINLEQPLRCINDECDYIDYKIGKIVRKVGKASNGNLIKLEESFLEDVNLPNIDINKGINNIIVGTDMIPNNIEVEYYK